MAPMSAWDHGRRFADICGMSALPPRAIIEGTLLNFSKLPAEII
jgi:hypothetical protein